MEVTGSYVHISPTEDINIEVFVEHCMTVDQQTLEKLAYEKVKLALANKMFNFN
jgi:hypothetical protein